MGSIQRTFPAHIPLYGCALFSVTAIAAVFKAYGIAPNFEGAEVFAGVFLAFISVIAFFAMATEMFGLVRDGLPQHPLQRMGKRLLARLCAEDRIGNIFHSVTTLFPLFAAFLAFKGAITLIHPFDWDAALSNLDRMIGFGRQPWQLLQPFLGHAPITIFLAYTYYVWFFVLYACLTSQGFSPKSSSLRMQFLVAMALALFLGGCVAALLFSSAGPCYFAHLNLGFDPYSAQLSYLRSIGPNPLPSIAVQDALWKAFAGGSLEEGVSAMPSMHVIIAVVIALFGWRRGGFAAFVLPVFALLITLGSVHLAWHYACDGIAGIGLATLFWYAAGRMVEAWDGYLAQYAAGRQTVYEGQTVPSPETFESQ